MLSKRWGEQDRYAAEIAAAADRYGVPRPVVYAFVATESAFNPRAFRAEPHLGAGEGSHGLMQILGSTARGEGYTGGNAGLFDPATNLDVGVRYLSRIIDRRADLEAAASEYNGGYRPSLGFGAPAPAKVRVCLARDSSGNCTRWQDVQPGEFANKDYVAKIVDATRYFQQYLAERNPVTVPSVGPLSPPATSPSLAGVTPTQAGVGLLIAAAAAALYALFRR